MARWVRLSSDFFRDNKVRQLDANERLLYIAGLVDCCNQMTDGELPAHVLPALALDACIAGDPLPQVDRLTDVGLWIPDGDGYLVPRYLDYNPSREQELERRERDNERKRTQRRGPNTPGVSARNPHGIRSESAAPSARSHTTTKRDETNISSLPSAKNPSGFRADAGCDDDSKLERINRTLRLLAEGDAARYEAAGKAIGNRRSFIASCEQARRRDHLSDLHKAIHSHPDWSAEQLAEAIEPTKPKRPPGKEDCPHCRELYRGRHKCSELGGAIYDPSAEADA